MASAGRWEAAAETATVTLAFADRWRRRLAMIDDLGAPFLLDLPHPARLADGDGLLLDDGSIVRVCAAPEDVIEVRAASPADAARIAWHLGNRHAAVQVLAEGVLRLLRDPVLETMLAQLGARVEHKRAPFDPEGGAYSEHRHGQAGAASGDA